MEKNAIQKQFEETAQSIIRRAQDRLMFTTSSTNRVNVLTEMKEELKALKDAYGVLIDTSKLTVPMIS